MKRMTALLAGAALMAISTSAMATTLDPNNVRQVPIGVSDPVYGEPTLQVELDKIFGTNVVIAATDQLDVGMFKVATPGSDLISPQFKFEWTSNSPKQGVGIFGWDGTNTIEALIFGGAHNAGDFANVYWATIDSGYIQTTNVGTFPTFPTTTTTLFSGISKNSFGFYFQPLAGSDPTFYSVDSLNPNGQINDPVQTARVLAYDGYNKVGGNSGILLSYEDGNDFDYQDAGFFVESIAPVPEPGTMMLLGAGFLGLAIYGKRRKNA